MNTIEPIDRPFDNHPNEKATSSIGWTIELILISFLGIGVIACDVLGFPRLRIIPQITSMILGLAYLFGNWWLAKPAITSFRTISITILYGFTSFVVLFAFVFKFMYLPGEPEMKILGFSLIIITAVLDILTSVRKIKVGNKTTSWRLAIFSFVILLYAGIDDNSRIRFSYRRYPEFLQYYDEHKDSEMFVQIEEDYFEK